MDFYPTERIALFIDGANLYAAAKSLSFDIDYKRLLALFRGKGQLVRALYYTALAEAVAEPVLKFSISSVPPATACAASIRYCALERE